MRKITGSEKGFSILEIAVAAGILAITFASIYTLYGMSLSALRSTINANRAQAYLVERVEILRSCAWGALTGTSGTLPNDLLAVPANNPNLAGMAASIISQSLKCGTSATISPTSSRLTQTGTNQQVLGSIPNQSGSTTLLMLNCVFELQWREKNRTISQQQQAVLSQEVFNSK